jgi:hypothetical protein
LESPSGKLFAELLSDVADIEKPLSAILLRARVLAARLRVRKFKHWVQSELNGYVCHADSLPPYRLVGLSSYGNFEGQGVRNEGVLLPVAHIPADIRQPFETKWFKESVGQLEGLERMDGDHVNYPWEPFMLKFYRQHPGVVVTNCQLVLAWLGCPKFIVSGVLHAIRSRLLEFLVELRERHSELNIDDSILEELQTEDIAKTLDQTIFKDCTFKEAVTVATTDVQAGSLSVGGDFVIAERIRDSFNKVSGAASSEVKELLGQLADALTQAEKHLPPATADQAAEDYETLAKEAARDQPRKSLLKAAGEVLVGTVKLAGEMAGPVASIVAAILKAHGA